MHYYGGSDGLARESPDLWAFYAASMKPPIWRFQSRE